MVQPPSYCGQIYGRLGASKSKGRLSGWSKLRNTKVPATKIRHIYGKLLSSINIIQILNAKRNEVRFRNFFQARSENEAFEKQSEIRNSPQLSRCAKEQVLLSTRLSAFENGSINIFYLQMAFVNIFVARLWHDLHDSKVFFDYLRDKLTKKLLKTKVIIRDLKKACLM